MRILWFTNTPSGYTEKIEKNKTIVGGWMASLEKMISKSDEVILGVAFIGKINHKISDQDVTYYSMQPIDKFSSLLERKLSIRNNKKFIDKYLKVIADFKPDLIHIWGSERNYGLLCQYTNIPIVIHLQGILSVYEHKWFNGRINQFKIFRYTRILDLLLKRGIFWQYYSFQKNAKRELTIFKNCNHYIGRTDWDRRVSQTLSVGSNYYHNDEMLREIFYKKNWHHKDRNKKILLTTIRGNIYKGLETIFEVANLIKNQSGIPFEWKIIGIDSQHELIRTIEKITKINQSKIPVQFLGTKNEDEMAEEMLNSDIFIHPSHIDNSPNSVCESMILGMPVIATYAGGTGSLLDDGKEGILIQDGDPYVLSGAILELLNDKDKAIHYGKNAQQRASKRHDKTKIVNELINIYQVLLDEENN